MANNWWDENRNQDDIYMRRGDDRTRDFGRGRDYESYRAGDQDAHRNDRDMAFGRENRPQSSYGRYDIGRRDDTSRSEFGGSRSDYGSRNEFRGDYGPPSSSRGQDRDMGFGYGGGGASDMRRDDWRSWADDRSIHRGSDRDQNRVNTWERQFGNPGGFGTGMASSYGSGNYESSRFNRNESRDYGLGFGRDDMSGRQDFGQREWSYRGSHMGKGPKGYRRSDERIREEVSETLERDPWIDASEIEVDVKEGVVTLRGHIEDRRQKRMAEDCIENLSGVRDVRNELTVNQSLFQRAKEALFGGSTEGISDSSKGDLIPDAASSPSQTAGQNKTRTNPRH